MAKKPEADVIWKDRKHFLWFPFSLTKYEVKNDRLYTQCGLFSTTYDELLLYRVTDIRLKRTLGQKLCGTGTIILSAKVEREREVLLVNVKKPKQIKNLLSTTIEESRNRKNVVGKEFYSAAHHDMPPMGPPDDDFDDDFDDLDDDRD